MKSSIQVGEKRIVLSSERITGENSSSLKKRRASKAFNLSPVSHIDNNRTKGILKVSITGWKEAVIDAIDDMLRKAKGLIPSR